MATSEIAIIIPALNEEATIEKVVSMLMPHGKVLVINDGSTDKTKELAKKAGAFVVSHKKSQGYDAALNTGFKVASDLNAKYVITFDADGQHDTSKLKEYITELKKGYRLVLGKRPFKARFSEKIMGFYFKKRFGIHDILCGMKGYDIDLYRRYGHFDTINSIGTELTFVSLKDNVSFSEILIPTQDREDIPRFGQFITANYKILKAFIKLVIMDPKI